MAKVYEVLVWSDPRLGGPHLYTCATTLRAAKREQRRARREHPSCAVTIKAVAS